VRTRPAPARPSEGVRRGLGRWTQVGYEFFDHDPETSQFRSHYFSSFGPYNDEQSHYKGNVEDDKFVLVGPARYVRELQADGSIKYDCDMPLPDGNWVPFMHATLTKV